MRIPLYSTLESRDGTLAADANLKNALVEVGEGDGTILVVKRPGIALTNEIITGGLAQGVADLNGLVYSVFDDTLLAFNPTAPETVTGGWNLGSASPILGGMLDYDNGETYDPGDFVIYPDEDGNDSVWFTVATVSGIPPGHTPAAYPYWSRYRNLPVGTHPTASYSFIGYSDYRVPPPGFSGTYPATSTVRIGVGIAVGYSYIVGSQSLTGTPAAFLVTYNDFYNSGIYLNGFSANNPVQLNPTQTDASDHPLYIAAKDYARSILA